MVFETRDQIIKRKKMAKYRLRAFIRKAFLNSYWLSELDDVTLGENVSKNITIILKRSQKRHGMMTIHDKRNLKMSPENRTKDQVEQLKKLFDELPCFQSISPVSFLRIQIVDYLIEWNIKLDIDM